MKCCLCGLDTHWFLSNSFPAYVKVNALQMLSVPEMFQVFMIFTVCARAQSPPRGYKANMDVLTAQRGEFHFISHHPAD